ncbi:tripartite tricarboxylate transporter TctB family protein [Faunimonas sp. B44]|uniref:tripartite tricarboxylate transporter TctB family protein n=1 Tax=Faunimonas sp. B44 TaxID=3461493 RepID=UPI0040440135
MNVRDHRDILGGLLVTAAGLFAAVYAATQYHLGTAGRMGPGMFPAVLGCIMALLGLAILLPALFRAGEAAAVEIRPILAILAGLAAFALTIDRFGLAPAIALLVVIASVADPRATLKGSLALSLALILVATAIFKIGLRFPFPLFAWPI